MRKFLPILTLLGCAAAFAFGIVYLFELRFEAGDVYPPYSTLRADPLGAMAFYESLEKIPGRFVRRDFSPSDQLPEEPQTAEFVLAAGRYDWNWVPQDAYQEIEHFLARGGRLVITYFPETEPNYFRNDEETNSTWKDKKMTPPKRTNHDGDDSDDEDSWISLESKWHFHTRFVKLTANGDTYAPVPVFNKTDLALPDMLDWHSGIVFTNLDPSWRPIFARGPDPVIIERKFGNGTVVIATDSYFVSNEAMTKDRHADLLAWLVGAHDHVVFDEAHLGIVETSGVATLMRKYRLHGLAAGLLLLAGLFIWKNGSSLVPPPDAEEQENHIVGKDSAAGFVNLLRRSIAPREVLAACFGEWKKSVAQIPASRLQQAEAIFSVEQHQSNPIATYRKISETLGTRNPNL